MRYVVPTIALVATALVGGNFRRPIPVFNPSFEERRSPAQFRDPNGLGGAILTVSASTGLDCRHHRQLRGATQQRR